jgi:hypothetical protein
MTFFTSDQHLGHRNIIRLCSRPFASIEEMDETLISRWCINKLTLLTAALKLFRKAKRTKNGRVRSPVFLAIGGGGHVDALLEEMREVPC